MPSYDDRTLRGWPLPFKSNTLEFDVERLRETFTAIDEALSAFEEGTRTLLNERVAGLEEKQYILDARMDVIAGQTTEDSEILDARVDAKGVTHPNVGHNVRELHSNILNIYANLQDTFLEFQGLLKQFNELAYAQMQGELNSQDAHARRKQEIQRTNERIDEETQSRQDSDSAIRENLVQEQQTRDEQDETLQAQTDKLSAASLRHSLDLHSEINQRRKDILQLDTALDSERILREQSDESIYHELIQSVDDLSSMLGEEADTRSKTDNVLHDALESETQARQSQDAALSVRISQNAEDISGIRDNIRHEVSDRLSNDEALQTQADELSRSGLQHSLDLQSEIDQRRKIHDALISESKTRAERDTALTAKILQNTEDISDVKDKVKQEISDRQADIFSEQVDRVSSDEALQEQTDKLSHASLQHSLDIQSETDCRRKADEALQQSVIDTQTTLRTEMQTLSTGEADIRSENDRILQGQTDALSNAGLQNSLNIQQEAERRRKADEAIRLETAQGLANIAADLNEETLTRIQQDEALQAQADKLSQASLQQAVNLVHEAEERRELSQVVAGIKSPVDWSKAETLAIPEPRCAVVNFSGLKAMPTSKTADIPAVMEFWDRQGNYFRKNIVCSAQGDSSMSFPKKNIKLDLLNDDGSEFDLKIGDWVVQDGFHLKAYYTDFFRGVAVTSYRLWDEIMETVSWKKALVKPLFITPTMDYNGSDLTLQTDTGALCHPDGFPCLVYLNGTFYGVYSWQIKKQRKNYHQDKSTVEHIHLDGHMGGCFSSGVFNWGAVEIRNPNKLYTMDGKKYDGDYPKELIDETSEKYNPDNKDHVRSATVKKYIQDLLDKFTAFRTLYNTYRTSDPDQVKAAYEEIFDWKNQRDYLIFSDITKNTDGFSKNWQWFTYDGVKWFVGAYDLDMSFGGYFTGTQITAPITGHVTTSTAIPTYYAALLYKSELEARYKELRDAGVIDVEHIAAKLEDWVSRIGTSNYELEYERWPNSPCILSYHDSVDRVRKWLTDEIANMDKLYGYVSEADMLNSRMLSIEQASPAETQTRVIDVWNLQYQINKLALTVLKLTLKMYEDREEFKTYISAMYQVLADTGNMTYMGAKVASSHEVNDMLADILSGTDSGEVYESEIPEELRDKVASSTEITNLLAEIFPNQTGS